MNKEELLSAFARLSAEDQNAVREQLGLDPMAMCKSMMERMKGGSDPIAVCKDTMEQLKGKCCTH